MRMVNHIDGVEYPATMATAIVSDRRTSPSTSTAASHATQPPTRPALPKLAVTKCLPACPDHSPELGQSLTPSCIRIARVGRD